MAWHKNYVKNKKVSAHCGPSDETTVLVQSNMDKIINNAFYLINDKHTYVTVKGTGYTKYGQH